MLWENISVGMIDQSLRPTDRISRQGVTSRSWEIFGAYPTEEPIKPLAAARLPSGRSRCVPSQSIPGGHGSSRQTEPRGALRRDLLGPLKMGKSEEEAYACQKQKLEALTCRECTKAGSPQRSVA